MPKQDGPAPDNALVFLDLVYAPDTDTLSCQGRRLRLTTTERNLIIYLIRHQDRVVTRQAMLQDIWGYNAPVETRVTDENIRRLRIKLREAGSQAVIRSVWGVGYRLVAPDSTTKNPDSQNG